MADEALRCTSRQLCCAGPLEMLHQVISLPSVRTMCLDSWDLDLFGVGLYEACRHCSTINDGHGNQILNKNSSLSQLLV